MATVMYFGFVVITLAMGSTSASASASTSTSTSAKFSIPFLGDKVCKVVVCGKGKCVASNSSSLGYECECEKGWTQSRPHDSDSFKFLPCVVPYFNFSGDKAPTPAPAPAPSHNNSSFIDPCSWTNCGGGTCKKTSMLTHTCECNEGYYNLFNSTSFPCLKKRAIGGDSPDSGNNTTNSSDRQSSSEVADSGEKFSSNVALAFVSL
ncbi:uncharacterized protein LOC121796955 [Salvia splendens]|uniref:uncharacterized protein LOC121796955 n=1 Tax=Salvia splendens TaxID=180675 RepID=UPI001C279119|nr:uncharacterized protein LOC121796955 [Salvia splendens]